jgi:hypothetical protein
VQTLVQTGLVAEYEWLSPIADAVPLEGREAGPPHLASFELSPNGSSGGNKSGSDDTVRQNKVDIIAVHSTATNVRGNSPKIVAMQGSSGVPQTRLTGRNGNGSNSPKDPKSGSPVSAGATEGKGANSSSSSDKTEWKISYSRPPLSKAIACGPMSWTVLAERLSLDDETASGVHSFPSTFARLISTQMNSLRR